MNAIRKNDRTKYLQIILCSIIGMATAFFVGKQGAITVASTALLVIYTDRGYAGSVSYILGRIKLQCFMGAIVLASFYLLRAALPVDLWLVEMLTLAVSLIIGLIMYHNRVLGPLSISVGITVLIVLAGIVQDPRYPLMRLVNCMLGCAIATAVSLLPLLFQNRPGNIMTQVTGTALDLLGEPGDLTETKRRHMECGRALELLQKDHRWERRRLSKEDLERIASFHRANDALLQALACVGEPQSPTFADWADSHIQQAMRAHSAVLGGKPPAPVTAGQVPVNSEREAQAAGALLRYIQAVNDCTEQMPAKDTGPLAGLEAAGA